MEGESTFGNLQVRANPSSRERSGTAVSLLSLDDVDDILTMPEDELEAQVSLRLKELGVLAKFPEMKPHRAVFCNRTLNLRSIQAVGFDMDYTLVQYNVKEWEGKSYEYGIKMLADAGIPVDGLTFDPELVCRGLIVDTKHGNLVKVDRFGLIKRAMHGNKMLSPGEIRATYGREHVALRDDTRWIFLNTLFSVSEGCMYMQARFRCTLLDSMVERLDANAIPDHLNIRTYEEMWATVSRALFQTHVESHLKSDINNEPAKFVELEPGLAKTLLDMKDAGKVLLLITNSDWTYTNKMMSFSYDRFLPDGQTWRNLFDMIIVEARKPSFWAADNILYEIVDTESGLMRPANKAVRGGVYSGGSAKMVQKALGLQGDSLLYVGDHIYTDNALAKLNFQWRTALILRELEAEVEALALGRPLRRQLQALLTKKELVGDLINHLRVGRARLNAGHEMGFSKARSQEQVQTDLTELLLVMSRLDQAISPLVEQDGVHFNEKWGYLSIAGVNDKSQLIRQIEKYADIYSSSVANLARYTPYYYFRTPGQTLAHERDLSEYYAQQHAQQLQNESSSTADALE